MSSKPVFVALDVETTGLLPGVDRIVELAGVVFQGDRVLGSFVQLVDPGIPMPPEAGRVNGITDDMLRGMPPVEEALPGFLALLSEGTPVAHNAPFDVGFLYLAITNAGARLPVGPVLDTRSLSRHAFPGRFSYSLVNLVRDKGLEVEGAHRALADANACRLLFLECLNALQTERCLSVEELAGMSGPLDFTSQAPRQALTAALLQRALKDGTPVEIAYRSASGELTERRIQPLSFSTVGGSLAVVAFCMLRKDKRTFLVESITEVRPGT